MGTEADVSALMNVVNVSRETIDKLQSYERLLKHWTQAINLISKSTETEIWPRHFLDSAQFWNLRPENCEYWLDLGTGGGFPGLVVAVIASELDPEMRFGFVESDARKASFLLKAGHELGIKPKIHIARAESLEPQSASVVSVRAMAPVQKLLGYARRHMAEGGLSLFAKGENHETELTEAQKYWKFDVQKVPSITDASGTILKIKGITRV